LVADDIAALRSIQPEGPYQLGGYCSGGLVAFEVAQELWAQGERVELLALLETPYVISRPTYGLYRLMQKAVGKFLPETRREQRRIVQIATALFNDQGLDIQMQLLRRYKPRPYPGRITLFLASWSIIRFSQMRWQWRRIAGDGLEIGSIPGDHDSFVRGIHAPALAEQLRVCLDKE
jgi:thioesterase domain-containing protein